MERAPNRPLANALYAALGLLAFFSLWEWIGKAGIVGPTLPAPTDVAKALMDPDTLPLLGSSCMYTLASAAKGLLFGASLATLLAVVIHLLPPLRPGLDRLAVLVNTTPPIAIGPILIVVFSRSQTPAVLAGIQVFFLFYVAASSGLAAASPALGRVMIGFGASPWKRLCYLDLPASLPHLASGLKAAVAASFLGAILGEWFGAPHGLGLVILNAMQNFQVQLMWAAVVVAAAMSLTAFLLAAGIEKIVLQRFGK
ncbi:MAG TPA: ABC transporter permease subunit [Candidatus Acidoferrum sp.]|nr:ABC transporter permease subunit [Candidatus Acidoferrum sp.]